MSRPPEESRPRSTHGSLTDVAGIEVGHWTETRRPTGCTVVLTRAGAVAGVDVRGAAPGTRETDLLSPLNAVEKVHALMLGGGSAFGLAAADGVMRWLAERGIGVQVGPARVPIVPAAILFDLWLGDPGIVPPIAPDAAAGYAACEAASALPVEEGNVGAGTGASVGKLFGIARAMRGGLGSASIAVGGITVAALAAVNALGDVIDPASGEPVAGARSADGRTLLGTLQAMRRGELPAVLQPGAATTLGIVATDAALTKAQANKLAQMAHDGFARSINPVHTMGDGDTIFALATGASGRDANLTVLGALGADVMALAVQRAVRTARTLHLPDGSVLPSAHDLANAMKNNPPL
ncbi:MAG TPA: P1 family peptidase [Burkholderiaceae bacterium]|nr:P1 family peptidase [Burkholderiaceae bacterium]